MFRKSVFLLCAAAGLVVAQPKPQQPPKTPPAQAQQKRDLTLEKVEESGAEPPSNLPFKMPPQSYALVIGINKYKNLPAENQLAFAEADANLMFTVLISREGGAFERQNVHMLTGDRATLANIRHELETWLPENAKEDDRVLVYFAGHGFLDRQTGKGYLAPYDIDPYHYGSTGLPMEEIGQVIGTKIRAKNKILLTDACHSGAITPEDTAALNNGLQRLNASIFSLTASRDREISREDEVFGGGHGVFTWYVYQGMQGAADNSPRDGEVTADELAEYVHTQVREATGGKQNPTSEKASFDPGMFLAYVPANAVPGKAPEPKFVNLYFVSDRDDTTVLLDGKVVGVAGKSAPLPFPGVAPGSHTVEGVHDGFEPYGPDDIIVYPGQDKTINIKIDIPKRRKKAALDDVREGLKCYLGKQGCTKGDQPDYAKAADLFQKALQAEPDYAQAAYYLGRTYNALSDEEKAYKYLQQAIKIQPDYLEAHATYAGMLLDRLQSDEAIRQLNFVLQRQPGNADGLTQMAQAYRIKGMYAESIDMAQKAIAAAPQRAEPHLWMGDSLRLSDRNNEAQNEYLAYLKLSNFDSKFAGKLNYWAVGFLIGMGKKSRAAEHDIWSDMRSLAYFGLCDSANQLKQYDSAIPFCLKALTYDPQDAFAHYALGFSYMMKAAAQNDVAGMDPALLHFAKVIELNPDLDQANRAKAYTAQIKKTIADYQAALRRTN